MTPTKIGSFAVMICAAVALFALVADFRARMDFRFDADLAPRTGVVFTGQVDRILFGLRLLEDHRLDRLFISGVNPGAGLEPRQFAEAFPSSPRVRAYIDDGVILLGDRARDTLQNAQETSCWLARHPEIQAVTLITSRYHMPRASLALQRALPAGFRITPATPNSLGEGEAASTEAREFAKFVATWAITLLPRSIWEESRPCPPHDRRPGWHRESLR